MVATGTQSPLLVFSYNVCNLLREVTSSASGSLTYTYLSDGTKVSAIKSDGSGERYIGSFVYTVPSSGSETLESAAWDEGRITFTKSGSTYTKTDLWFVKDHVGNVRTVVNITPGLSAPQVVERNDYLPFGTRISAGTAVLASNRFRLGGKESQAFGSLDLGKVDFGARMYDPFTARWTTADPLAAKYNQISPYVYCIGNPIRFFDDDGLDIVIGGANDSSITIKTDLIDVSVSVEKLGIDWRGNYTFGGYDFLTAALDIAGFVDQTGTSDFINAGVHWGNGNFWGGFTSAVGAFPLIGDLAKAGRIRKEVKLFFDAVTSSRNAAKCSFKTLEELGIKDGMKASSSEILDFGEQFLGKGYREVSPGRYISADGKRVVRIGDSDILGHHGGAPHANFETLVPNPHKPGKNKVDLNIHIYIND